MDKEKYIYVKTAATNIFIGGQNRWSAGTRQGAKVQVIPRTPQAEKEANYYARRGQCIFLPGRPNEVTRDSYDTSRPAKGFRPHKGKGGCLGHDPDGSPCSFPPENGAIHCFRHELQFK